MIPGVIDEMKARAELSLTAIDDAVANRECLLGDHFTGADIMMGYTVMLAEMMLDGDMPAHATAYWQRLQARPALAATRAAEASM